MTKDYYKILGIAEFDTAENIKSAYRKLARKWHPDIAGNTPDVIARFKEINEAYSILSNQVKKEEYDRARRFYSYAKNSDGVNHYKKAAEDEKKTKTKEKKFWEDLFASKPKQEPLPKRGDDVYSDIEISVFEAINGTSKTVNMLQTNICSKCNGRRFVNETVCPYCNGKGEQTSYKKFTVKIPAGIKNNSKIRLAGEGCDGKNGGAKGDLYITIHIKEPKTYKTEGLNILKTIPITPSEAVLGTNISVNTINGNISVKIAPNTQNGQKIRISGYGIVQNDKIGDMIITLEIRIPKNLSEEEIELYKKLEAISSIKNREDIYDR